MIAPTLQAALGQWPSPSPGTNSPPDCLCPGEARRAEVSLFGRPLGAHQATSPYWKGIESLRCRVVHRAWLWTTRRPCIRPQGVLSTIAKHPVGNPFSTHELRVFAALTPPRRTAEGMNRLPCPRGDCPGGLPFEGPHETRSPQGAGRPRRATGCSARSEPLERQLMSFPPRLPTRAVIPQL